MSIEAFVFRNDKCLLHDFWNFLDSNERAPFQAKFGDEPAVDCVQTRCLARLIPLELSNRWAARSATDEVPHRESEPKYQENDRRHGVSNPSRGSRVFLCNGNDAPRNALRQLLDLFSG